MGIPGFLIFMTLIVHTFKNFKRLKIFYSEGKLSEKIESQVIALEMSLVGFLACAFFLSHAYSSTMYLIFILSGAMISIASVESQLK
jgi:hypothetical protein